MVNLNLDSVFKYTLFFMLPLTENVLHVRIEYEESNLILVIKRQYQFMYHFYKYKSLDRVQSPPCFVLIEKKLINSIALLLLVLKGFKRFQERMLPA